MMFVFKKYIALSLACALLFLNLCACTKEAEKTTDISHPPVVSPDVTPADTPTPSDTSPDSIPAQSPTTSPVPTPGKTWSPQPADYDKAAAQAVSLVVSDMWAIDFLINLKMNGSPIYDDESPVPTDCPVIVPEYASLNDFLAKLDEIYTSSEAYSSFFMYPVFGNPQIFHLGGLIYVYPHYSGNFESRIDLDSIELTELTENSASFIFNIINNDYFQNGSMSMSLTPGGWRLDESFFFYCLERLDLLDTDSTTKWEDNPLLDPVQNAGSMRRLTGECMFYNIFINDLESTWDAGAIAGFYEIQNKAFRYLEGQAALFGKELYCSATDADNALYFDVTSNVPKNADNTLWFDSFLRDTEYGNVNGLLAELKLFADGIYFDNYGLMININKQGQSYSIPYNVLEDPGGAYSAERIVLFYQADSDNGYVLVSPLIAREILRISGAIDLYYPPDGEDSIKEMIMRYFPFEIMHHSLYSVPKVSVSAFTAFRVGWRNTLPDQLLIFQRPANFQY